MPLVITFLIIAMLIGVAYELGMRYVLTYRLTGEDVRDVLFGVVPVSIRRYRFITEVHTTSFFDGSSPTNGAVTSGVVRDHRDRTSEDAVKTKVVEPDDHALRRIARSPGLIGSGSPNSSRRQS